MVCCPLTSRPDDSVSRYTNYGRRVDLNIRMKCLQKEYRKTKRVLFFSKLLRSNERKTLTLTLHQLAKEKSQLKATIDKLQEEHLENRD